MMHRSSFNSTHDCAQRSHLLVHFVLDVRVHFVRAANTLHARVQQRRHVDVNDAVEADVRVVVATLALAYFRRSLRRATHFHRPKAMLRNLLLQTETTTKYLQVHVRVYHDMHTNITDCCGQLKRTFYWRPSRGSDVARRST